MEHNRSITRTCIGYTLFSLNNSVFIGDCLGRLRQSDLHRMYRCSKHARFSDM